MKQAQRKSFDWYKMQQRFSIRKYHFGAASVLLGTALVLGTAVNTQAEEQNPEATNSVSVDKIAETTKPAEVSTAKKETTYAAPTVVNPVEVTPAKSEAVKATVEKVEEPKVEKEEVSHQSAVDKSKLLTALSRAKKLEAKLYTEASAANLKASIQAGQSLLGKADATEAELSAAESSIQSAVIGLELRSNSDKGTVSETSVAKKADADEAEEETKQAPTTNRSALDSVVLPASTAAKVETTSAPASTNEILKPGLSLSDARQNPAIRKEDLEKGHSGFRAASNPANPIVSGSGNTVAFTDISQSGRSYSFRGYGNARGGNSIHYDVTTVRQGNRLNFTIQYSGPGEFVNNNFILDKGDGFGNPSNATITTPRLREQSKPISQGANFVSHSGYTMTSATETSMQQTIRFSLPINNPNGDLSVRLKPVTFNVDQGGGGAATSNDPYSNSNYYYRANPLYLDANPNGGSSNKVVTEDIDFQTVYLPTSKLPEGQTRLVREGEKGQRQITYKVHRFGNETILGLPISNSVTKEAKPRILQIGVAKELIDTVKPRVDQNKVGDTNNLTFYLDNDGNGVYTEGVDELVQKIAIKDGAKGEKGDQGERGLTGAKGEKGDQGERGLTGAKGEKGDQGERGLTGAKGEKGDRGERGLTGAKGEKGDQGERGLTGAKGEKGDQGERGLTGAKGEKGDRGERGLTGAKGEKGDQGQAGRDGVTPTVTVKDNKDDGTHTITINDGRGNVTSTVVRDGFDGASPLVATQRNDADKTTTVIFYYDQNDNNEFDAGDTKLKEVVIADGAKGEKGDKGATPKVTTARGEDGHSTDITFTVSGEEPVTVNIKDGKDGRTPTIDLNALVEAVRRGVGSTSNSQPSGTSRSARNRRALPDEDRSATESSETVQPSTTGLTGSQPATAGSTASQPPSTQPKPSGEYAGTEIKAYYDNNHNGVFDEGDELISSTVIPPAPKGENGNDGKDAIRGAELLSGIIAPRPEDGKDGDTYIDATTGDVYKKRDGAWGKIGNIRGPQGEQGQKGDKGENGKDGRAPKIKVEDITKSAESAGVSSRSGIQITVYDDKNNNDVFDEGDTILNTKDVYNGTDGKNGADGQTPKVKAERDEAKKQTTLTFYIDKDGDGNYTEGTDTLVQTTVVKDGQDGAKGADGASGRDGKEVLNGKVDPKATDGKDGDSFVNTETGDVFVKKNNAWEPAGNIKGPKGDKGENGKDGFTPEVTVTDNNNGTHTITITQPDNKPSLTTIVKNGADGQTPKVKAERDEAKKQTTLTFYIDKDGDGNYTEGTDTLVQTTVVKDGQDGAKGADGASGRDGKEVLNGKVDPKATDGKDGDSFVNTETGDVFVKKNNAWEPAGNIKGPKGEDGKTPEVTVTPGKDGNSSDITFTVPGKNPVTVNVKNGENGLNGKTPKVDLLRVEGQNGNPSHTIVTFYTDENGDGKYTPGTDELLGSEMIKDGASGRDGKEVLNGKVDPKATDGKDGDSFVNTETGDVFVKKNNAWEPAGNIKGPKGDKGEDGKTPEITTKPGADGKSTDVTITVPGKDPVTVNIKDGKDGKDGKSLVAKKEGNETKIYVEDPANPGQPLDPTKPLATVLDGLKGEKGDKGENGADGKSPVVNVTDNGDGTHSITVRNPDGSESTTKVKDGKDGKTATITTTENPDGSHTITVTNPDGTTKETVVKNGKDGKTPKVEVTDNGDGTHTVKVTDGDGNVTNAIIKDGKDGKAATATTTENPDGSHTVTITNPDGTKNEFVVKNGRDGVDGRTPTASVRDNGDGSHTIVITNPEGVTTETTVRDGKSPKVTITDEQNGTHKISVLNGDGTTTETIIKDGKSPVATVTDNHDGTYTIHVENGNGTVSETTVRDGKSPTAKVVDNGDGTHTITVVNSDGTTTTTIVRDGKSPKLEVIDNNNGSHTIKVTGADGKETTTTIFDGKSPKANIVDNGDGTHTLTIVDSDGREYKSIIKDGKDGKDGVSPTVTVKNNNDGTHVVTIINPDGSKTEMVIKDGKDGKSPKVSVEDNGNGSHTITIINSDGTVTKTVVKDGKDGKCGCKDKPVTPSNDKPVPPVNELPEYTGGVTPLDPPVYEKPELELPEIPTPPVHEVPEFNGGVPGMPEVNELPEAEVPGMPTPPVHEIPEFNGGVPGMPEVNELPNPEVPGMPTPPVHEIPEFNGGVPGMPEVNDKPTSNISEVPTQPNPNVPVQPVTPLTSNPVAPTTGKENHGDKLPETGSQSDYISVLLGSGILLSLYVGRRKED
ncbi:YSIRK-type signal peptide-containing protein [Streptococcus sp. D2]|uniref:pneumococcal collagen-like adhesin PclA n=1 Tax=Streptococcus sp. D2 TaxID=2589787 RepID=UPI001129AD72|nr:SIALI-17 repeat-containing surface protein [Streptococcus sp. D2]TPE41086.1 YSIRK-type signal peptide-containing protein [Streptococcus sp. D2]